MPKSLPYLHFDFLRRARIISYLAMWLLLIAPMAAATGSASALFLWSLEKATDARIDRSWLFFLLPVAGAVIGATYHRFGRKVEGGANLLIEAIHEPTTPVPLRIGPMILVATIATHLFGGSAGREGTAVQMGGAIASGFDRLFRLAAEDRRILLMCGIAAGFASVFGTPLAGAVFAMEVLALGRIDYRALVPVLIAALIADWTTAAWGIEHTGYHISLGPTSIAGLSFDGWLMAKVVVAGAGFGLVAMLFSETARHAAATFRRLIPSPVLRPVVGGLIVIALVYVIGTRDYLGLGVSSPDLGATTIVSSFRPDGASDWAWWWKIVFTTITIGSGFKGGEVTPLFFIGAAFGNRMGALLHAPADLFAGLGFVGVFAGAAKTPIACTVMGIELFGSSAGMYLAVACYAAYLFSGRPGIYPSQRLARSRGGHVADGEQGRPTRVRGAIRRLLP